MLSNQQTEKSCQLKLSGKVLVGLRTYDHRPYLCGVTGPEQPMLIGTDCPENWNCQSGEGSNGDATHTERVDQEIVLDLVYVPRMRSALEKANCHGTAQEVHLLTGRTDFTEFLQYVMSPGSGFSERKANAGGRDITGLPRRSVAVVVSTLCTPRTDHKYHPAYGKRSLDFER